MTTQTKANSTKTLACSCVSDFQDKQYGAGNRIMNRCKKADPGSKTVTYRCTVCGALKHVAE